MADTIVRNVIYDLQFKGGKSANDVLKVAESLERADTAFESAKTGSLGFVEAERKITSASAQLGKSMTETTEKTRSFDQTMLKAATAINAVAKSQQAAATQGDALITNVDQLKIAMAAFAKEAEKLNSLDEKIALLNQFADLLPADQRATFIDEVNTSLENFDTAVSRPAKELRELKRQIAAGELEGDALVVATKRAAALADEIGDVSQRINNLASDTAQIDGLVGVAEGAVGAFTAFQGALALTSSNTEEYQKALAKAQGALAVLQGTQATLKVFLEESAAKTFLVTNAQKVYTAVVGTSTGALRGFKLALAATGIGALVFLIGALVANWDAFSEAVGLSNKELDRHAAINKKAAEASAQEVAAIEVAKAKLKDENISREEKTRLIEELKQQYPGYLQNIDSEKSSYDEVLISLDKVNNALLTKAKIDAAQELLTEKVKQKLTIQNQALQDNLSLFEKGGVALQAYFGTTQGALETAISTGFANQKEAIGSLDDEINALLKDILGFNSELNKLGGDPNANVANATATSAKNEAQIKAGTIAALEAVVNGLRDRLTKDLRLDSEEFNRVVVEYIDAQQRLTEAQDKLKASTAVSVTEVAADSIKGIQAELSSLQELLDGLSAGAENYDAVISKIIETQARLDELRARQQRPDTSKEKLAELSEEERHNLALNNIREQGEIKALEIRILYAKKRLEVLKASSKADKTEIIQAENEIAEMELELEKKLDDSADKGNAKRQERIQAEINGYQQILNSAISTANQLIEIEKSRVQQQTEIQQQRVNDARKLAEDGNANILKLEEKRLDDLNKKREKFVRAQQALIAIQIVAESALAIAKAAAEGGVAAPFTIAATLIALVAGLAQARQAASQAAFYEGGSANWSELGGFTGSGNARSVANGVGRKPYTYHREEYIMPHQVTGLGNNRKWFEHIHLNRIDLDRVFSARDPQLLVSPSDSSEVVRAIRDIPGTMIQVDPSGVFKHVTTHKHKANRIRTIS